MSDPIVVISARKLLKLQRDRADSFELLDIALDLLGVPKDNTAETGACDVANTTGKWPEWGFCRDSYYNSFEDMVVQQNDIDGFIVSVTSPAP